MSFDSVIINLLETIYFFLPAAFANMAPVFVKKLNFLNYPIDSNKTFRGKRIFGKNKTWRGMIFAIIFSIALIYLQNYLYSFSWAKDISLIDYTNVNLILLGFLFGFGAMLGDLIESFFKRQFDIKPGSKLLIFDQTDWVLGSGILTFIYLGISWEYLLGAFIIFLFLHILVKHIGYYIGLEDKKW